MTPDAETFTPRRSRGGPRSAGQRRGAWPARALLPVAIWLLTVVQLVAAVLIPDLPQFDGKAFGWRLAAFPPAMLVVPALWWWAHRGRGREAPFGAFALVMAPFLFDVTGNSLNLYDSVNVFDDLAHVVTWFLLCAGLGLLLPGVVNPAWVRVTLIAGIGALLAIGYELAEWYTFIRFGTNDDDPYQDTLGDLALGVLGGLCAALLVGRTARSGHTSQA